MGIIDTGVPYFDAGGWGTYSDEQWVEPEI